MKEWLDRIFGREIIGEDECPLMYRWTIYDDEKPYYIKWAKRFPRLLDYKLMLHYFPPGTTDSDPHDHPRSFMTIILKGGYWNTEWQPTGIMGPRKVKTWVGRGIQFRRAEHMHITETGDIGCWTFVMMGPFKRPWGFLRLTEFNRWWPMGEYIKRFGGTIRCPDGVQLPPDQQKVAEDRPE